MVSLKYVVAVCESMTVDILPAHMPLGAILGGRNVLICFRDRESFIPSVS